LGAKKGGFAHDTGEGSISTYHRVHGGDLIWEIGSGYFGCRNVDGSFNEEKYTENALDPQVKMVEIKLSQGAKPGHGGILPGPKVTAEIAKARSEMNHAQDDLEKAQNRLRFTLAAIHFLNSRYKG
jgi:glutamate synthase domain-containing protein 2